MAYFIYNKSTNNQIYKIAENDSDLNALIIPQDQYLVVDATQSDFDSVKLNLKSILNYNGSSVELKDIQWSFDRVSLQNYINSLINNISDFLDAQPQSSKYQLWKDYQSELTALPVQLVIPNPIVPLTTSLEVYLNSKGKTYLNLLQIP
jgi:hypothetical protein